MTCGLHAAPGDYLKLVVAREVYIAEMT